MEDEVEQRANNVTNASDTIDEAENNDISTAKAALTNEHNECELVQMTTDAAVDFGQVEELI